MFKDKNTGNWKTPYKAISISTIKQDTGTLEIILEKTFPVCKSKRCRIVF